MCSRLDWLYRPGFRRFGEKLLHHLAPFEALRFFRYTAVWRRNLQMNTYNACQTHPAGGEIYPHSTLAHAGTAFVDHACNLGNAVHFMNNAGEPKKKVEPPVPALPHATSLGSRVPAAQIERSRELALAAVKAAAENRGQDIVMLDLTSQTALFDFFVIASGSSRRQLSAMGAEIDRLLKHDFGERRLSAAGYEESRWIVLDFGSIVVHLFDEDTREFYNLESLWADAKPVDITSIVEAASASMAKFSE